MDSILEIEWRWHSSKNFDYTVYTFVSCPGHLFSFFGLLSPSILIFLILHFEIHILATFSHFSIFVGWRSPAVIILFLPGPGSNRFDGPSTCFCGDGSSVTSCGPGVSVGEQVVLHQVSRSLAYLTRWATCRCVLLVKLGCSRPHWRLIPLMCARMRSNSYESAL